MTMKLSFLGAAKNVTGSRYVLDTGDSKILVDCGLYQERKFISRNWDPFPVPPRSLSAMLLTHAHLDHCLSSARLSAETGAPILMHEDDLSLYADLARWGRMFGVPVERPGTVARTLVDGDLVADLLRGG